MFTLQGFFAGSALALFSTAPPACASLPRYTYRKSEVFLFDLLGNFMHSGETMASECADSHL